MNIKKLRTEIILYKENSIIESISIISAVFAFVVYLILSFLVLNKGHMHEDAYILFTYAKHLANGNGIVYFAGGEPAEGATDFLWMVSLAFLKYLGADIGISVTILNGLGIGLIAYLLTYNLHWKKQYFSRLFFGILLVFLLITSDITAASIAGFSTAVYTSISVLMMHLYLNGQLRQLRYLPLLSLLIGLIRPDGVIIGVLFTLIGIGRVWNTKYKVTYLYSMIIGGMIGGIYFVWRLNYFRLILPLPLYVKSYSETVFPGLIDNLYYLLSKNILIVISVLTILLADDIKRYVLRYVLALVPVLTLLFSLIFAQQTQNVSHRFQAPVTGSLLFLLALFINNYLKGEASWRKKFLILLIIPIIAASTGGRNIRLYKYLTNTDYINYFPFLAKDIFTKKVKVALTEAGRFAYWNDIKLYDLIGLNTPEIAKNKLDIHYLEYLDPDVIFIHTAGTLISFDNYSGNTFEASMSFIDQHIDKKLDWHKIKNPVKRAPYVVYNFLRDNHDQYNLIFARYGKNFSHLYAIKKDGEVNWFDFKKILNDSFKEDARMPYLKMKNM